MKSTFVKNRLDIFEWVCFLVFYSLTLICVSLSTNTNTVLIIIANNKSLNQVDRFHPLYSVFFFFQNCLSYSKSFVFPFEFYSQIITAMRGLLRESICFLCVPPPSTTPGLSQGNKLDQGEGTIHLFLMPQASLSFIA